MLLAHGADVTATSKAGATAADASGGTANGEPSAQFGLPPECVAPSGWLRVDDRFRLCTREYDDNAAAAR